MEPRELTTRDKVSWTLLLLGGIGMLVGAIDPLEGSVVIAVSLGIAAVGAYLGHTRRRALVYWSLALVVLGVAAMIVLSMLGGVGGPGDLSTWWLLAGLPYPMGWIGGLIGTALGIGELWQCGRLPSDDLPAKPVA